MPDDRADGPTALLEETGSELKPGTEVGGYIVDGKIGEGGMGVVYGARHPRIGKRAAIKVLAPGFCGDPTTVSRFEQEARLVNEIRHPNIVDVFQFGELADKRSFFVMEWLDGEPLSARIDRGPLTTAEAIEVLDVVCDALEAAHEHGVIHRDLKSDNVFLCSSRGKRTVKLLDFGLAKLSGRGDPASVAKTRSGILVGTPSYMSPEQARGKAIDTRTDIYSLGVLAYKMVTGRLPFDADNPMDMIMLHLKAPPPDPMKLAPKLPPELARAIVRMMAKQAEARPTLAELRALFAKLRGAATPAATHAPAKRHLTSILIGAGLFLAGMVALGVVWFVKYRDTSETPAAAAAAPEPVGSAVAPEPVGSAAPVAVAAGSAAFVESAADAAVPIDAAAIAGSAAPTGSAASAIGSAGPGSAAPAGSAAGSGSAAPKKKHTSRNDSNDVGTFSFDPKTPGAVMLILERASTIEIDGNQLATGSRGGRFEVRPGHHDVRIKTPNRSPITRSVDVEPGGTAVIRIDDAAASDDPDPP